MTTLHDQLRERVGLDALADYLDRRAQEEARHADAPESDDERYAIYVVTSERIEGRAGWREHRRVATTSVAGIGLCLRTLREEDEITNDSRVGILDRETRQWLVNPWAAGR